MRFEILGCVVFSRAAARPGNLALPLPDSLRGGAAAKVAQFVFLSAEGFTRTKTVVRAHPDARTGRFYVPMTGLWPGGARSVDIRLDTAMSGTPRVTACQF